MAAKNSAGELNDREERFARQYVIDLNVTRAAIRAGYSKKTAYSTGHDTLKKPEVAARIKHLQDARAARLEIRADRVLQEIARIAFSDMKEFGSWDDAGFKLLPSVEMHPDESSCIAEFAQVDDGKKKTLKFKLHSKPQALANLAKHLGLMQERSPLDSILDFLPADVANQLRTAIAAAIAGKKDSTSS